MVVQQGDPADGLYVVPRGSFGEMALLTDSPRSATVRCESEGELLWIGELHFRALLRRDAAIACASPRRSAATSSRTTACASPRR